MPSVKYSDLEMALSLVSAGYMIDTAAYIDRKNGKIYCKSSELDEYIEVPDDVGDSSLYATVPGKHDLDLGKRLVLRFTALELPGSLDQVDAIFRRQGAYSRYKDLLEGHGLLEKWYRYEEAAIEAALREWAEGEGFTVEPTGEE